MEKSTLVKSQLYWLVTGGLKGFEKEGRIQRKRGLQLI